MLYPVFECLPCTCHLQADAVCVLTQDAGVALKVAEALGVPGELICGRVTLKSSLCSVIAAIASQKAQSCFIRL